jgi:thioredoxin-related protein
MVVVNGDDEEIPLGLRVQSTPTLIFIQPKNKRVLMQLVGIRALGELLEILNEAVEDGHREGYLRP